MKQNIIVFTDDTKFGKAALSHAQILAKLFEANVDEIPYLNDLDFSERANLIFSNAENFSILMIVIGVALKKGTTFFHRTNVRKHIVKSRVPVLVVGDELPSENCYKNVILPITSHCETKELALWATYFPTNFRKNCPQLPLFNDSVQVLFTEYKAHELQQKQQKIIDFTEKLFENVNTNYELQKVENRAHIYKSALQFSQNKDKSLVLILTTKHLSFIDLIFGTIENQLFGNEFNVPILCLNPRDDIYLMCQ